MNDILAKPVALLGGSQRPDPNLFQPIRNVANDLGNTMASIRPNSTQSQWNTYSPQDKVSNVLKAAVSYGGEGLLKGAGNGLAASLDVSPPGQLVQYAIGNPDPINQAKNGIDATLAALATGGYLKSDMPPIPPKEYIRNAIGQFSKKPVQWISDLMGGVI